MNHHKQHTHKYDNTTYENAAACACACIRTGLLCTRARMCVRVCLDLRAMRLIAVILWTISLSLSIYIYRYIYIYVHIYIYIYVYRVVLRPTCAPPTQDGRKILKDFYFDLAKTGKKLKPALRPPLTSSPPSQEQGVGSVVVLPKGNDWCIRK